jgi:hypothetical protein
MTAPTVRHVKVYDVTGVPWQPCSHESHERPVNKRASLHTPPPGLFLVIWSDGSEHRVCGFHLDSAIMAGLADG